MGGVDGQAEETGQAGQAGQAGGATVVGYPKVMGADWREIPWHKFSTGDAEGEEPAPGAPCAGCGMVEIVHTALFPVKPVRMIADPATGGVLTGQVPVVAEPEDAGVSGNGSE